MLLALSTVSVAAAQLFAPEEFKPSNLTGLTKKPEPKPEPIKEEEKPLKMDKEGEIKTEVVVDDEIDTGKNWTGQITLRPKNYAQFEKFVNNEPQVISDDGSGVCGVYGLTAYTGKEFNPSMIVVNYNDDASKSSVENPSQKERFDMVNKYIDGLDKNDYGIGKKEYNPAPWLLAFNVGCGGYGSNFLYNLDNSKVNFKNVDKFTAIVNLEGQSIPGEPAVLILAKKGDNLIQLRKGLGSNVSGCTDKNISEINNGKLDGYTKCISTPEFKALAQKTAEELVTTFELDQNSQTTPSTPSNTPTAQAPTKKLNTYTNPYFPDFKLVYPEDWKFETKTENVGTFYENYKNLLIRTVTISKNNKTIQITLQPKSLGDSNCGGAGAEPKLLQTFSNKLNKLNTFIGGDTVEYNFEVQSNGICPTKSYFNTSIDSNFDKDYVKSFPNDKIIQYSILIRVFNTNDGSYILTNDSTIGEIDSILSQSTLPKIIN
jgi:hypothetical protein